MTAELTPEPNEREPNVPELDEGFGVEEVPTEVQDADGAPVVDFGGYGKIVTNNSRPHTLLTSSNKL